jgi:GlcNAc-P-P-Und epimerase
MSDKILITGGSGFVGTNLVDFFIINGLEVRNFDINPPRKSDQSPSWKSVDIRISKLLSDEIYSFKPNIVLHCAARTDLNEKNNLDEYSANFDGVCNLIEAIRRVGTVDRVIFFSSQLVCRIGYEPKDFDDYQPTTLYGRSKALGEKIVKIASDFGPIWTIVRPTSLWGPWFDVPYKSFFTTIRRGLYIHPKGIRTRKQWGYIGNTVHQIKRLLESPKQIVHRKIFYMADFEPVDLRIFADKVQVALGAPPIHDFPLGVLKTAATLGDITKMCGWQNPPLSNFRLNNILIDELQDLDPLRQVVGDLQYSLDDGIKETVEWMEEKH